LPGSSTPAPCGTQLLKKKQSGQKIEAPRERKPSKVVNLMDVGKGPGTEADDGHTREGKPLMNPNVAIELGYAIDPPDRLEF